MKQILLLPGDGIGPEIIREAKKVADWFVHTRGLDLTFDEALIGGASIDVHGTSLTEDVLTQAKAADAVLLGGVGGPKWDFVEPERRPGPGFLRLRRELGLFANIRPVRMLRPLVNSSTLKPEVVKDVDFVIVRELVGDVYFGEPRGIETLPDGSERGFNTMSYTSVEVERVAHVAFELAAKRRGSVHSVDKANVLEAMEVWRRTVTRLGADRFPSIALQHLFVDNCAMQIVRDPSQFDVIVTGNIFGDILSDTAAMLTGSIGTLPSASIGLADEGGLYRGLYEPIHGTAPDIAGRNIANPLGTILSLAMLFRLSFGLEAEAAAIEAAVEGSLADGIWTADIAGGGRPATTREMGDAVVARLEWAAAQMQEGTVDG